MLSATIAASLLTVVIASYSTLVDRTPCCVDRISTVTCTRMRRTNERKFMERCSKDADFALVQCCSTCFDRRRENSTQLYTTTVLRQLQSPFTASCWDRRGSTWCSKLVQKVGFWDSPKFSKMGCDIFPFAFRECRQSCGYCSAGNIISRIRYDHEIATDRNVCDIKTYFARTEEESSASRSARQPEFDPLHLLKSVKRHKPDDYFVVTDHNYEVDESQESRDAPTTSVEYK